MEDSSTIEVTEKPRVATEPQDAPKQFFRTEEGKILNRQQNEQYVQKKVDQQPEQFSPTHEQVLSVLGHVEKSRAPDSTPQPETAVTTADAERALEEVRNILAETDPTKLVERTQREASELVEDLGRLRSAEGRSSLANLRRILLRLSPLVLAVSAILMPRDTVNVEGQSATTPVSPPAAAEPITQPPTSEISATQIAPKEPEFTAYTVQPSDSITGILAKMHPEKYLDEQGHFKADEITQDELYARVGEVLDLNRDTLQPQNPDLYGRIDEIRSGDKEVRGYDLRGLVQQTGGPYEVVTIQPSQRLTFPNK
ncbi:hypothetical protein A2W45_03850 [Candidatus Curtissbacteria bacterium RIFCSPHIGHO2_12_41_11]|uniref:Uncharacterized protein n=3 Tax=Candidatus Curtissiibacteriota TaxID=1752717 RepID=A0A1F5HQ47_9BACT|nr:MAG: hypothetical protein UU56_C0005G0038 [Candidatus Curtissbacteria bacterium GW2011_GWA2_41_24]OGD89157.1 MAG: hypothetical protein A2Z54_01185 [Candidatus Curtissbacteria bacterium RIFCSPHIGHO2_02_39_8]OGD98391.1 MAG: hypothetical protein A2W45_03850 [Candidatus Curtissbacteria bacterium RIFCSPHIGHO2_12_41_11]OGE06266.1 MAG: hypothetical protein A2W70_00310 [Candidatus Curtissbacteria bacterium RIFCSPLOWO2_02_41_11]